MDEQTGTEELVFDASDFESVANDTSTEQAEDGGSSAVEATTEQTTSENEAVEESAATSNAQTGDAIDEFLAKKGIDRNDPEALSKVAKMYQDVEKGFYSKSQEKAQLERRLSESRLPSPNPAQEALSEVHQMRTEMEVERWKMQRNLTPEAEAKMVQFLSVPLTDARGNVQYQPNGQPYTKGVLVNNGLLSLDDVYKLSGCEELRVDNLKENLRNEVRKEMAAKQTARRTPAASTDSTKFGRPESEDPFASALLGL